MDALFDKSAVQYLQPKLHQVKGKASKEIPLLAQKHQIDLIVMGTVGRVGIPGLIIGNTAESILEQTQCSVLAIKPKGFQTPIK
ncbi:universal stress protein [Pseudoalteromonas sp. DL2-H2.2]|nr:universal stress protein [Pseudoalteromonas sp. DL2-H2.2]MCF2906962.1 universal stress protein [Pseudoalteromonas sp. DL2-H2.2]